MTWTEPLTLRMRAHCSLPHNPSGEVNNGNEYLRRPPPTKRYAKRAISWSRRAPLLPAAHWLRPPVCFRRGTDRTLVLYVSHRRSEHAVRTRREPAVKLSHLLKKPHRKRFLHFPGGADPCRSATAAATANGEVRSGGSKSPHPSGGSKSPHSKPLFQGIKNIAESSLLPLRAFITLPANCQGYRSIASSNNIKPTSRPLSFQAISLLGALF